MPLTGPIIIMEDDKDDQEILAQVFQDLGIPNELLLFDNGSDMLYYLKNTTQRPFLVLTDVNLPGLNGIQVREEIMSDAYLSKKCIPYIFLSTSNSRSIIKRAYELQAQGYFQKPNSIKELQSIILQIVEYWKVCLNPNSC